MHNSIHKRHMCILDCFNIASSLLLYPVIIPRNFFYFTFDFIFLFNPLMHNIPKRSSDHFGTLYIKGLKEEININLD